MNFAKFSDLKNGKSGTKEILEALEGDPSACGLGYVDINSVSFGGYPETELSQHNQVRDQQTHPVVLFAGQCEGAFALPKAKGRVARSFMYITYIVDLIRQEVTQNFARRLITR